MHIWDSFNHWNFCERPFMEIPNVFNFKFEKYELNVRRIIFTTQLKYNVLLHWNQTNGNNRGQFLFLDQYSVFSLTPKFRIILSNYLNVQGQFQNWLKTLNLIYRYKAINTIDCHDIYLSFRNIYTEWTWSISNPIAL